MSELTVVEGRAVKSLMTFKTTDGEIFDPTRVYCRIKPPQGEEVTYQHGIGDAIVRLGEGVYRLFVATNSGANEYRVRWIGYDANGVKVANEDYFNVEATGFTTPDPE